MVPTNLNILVINVARIGDTLMTTPVLRALKEGLPGYRITCLAHPKRADVLRGLPWIDELGVVTPRRAAWRRRFGHRQRDYDYALVYGHDAPLIHYVARVAQRVVAFAQPDASLNRLLWKCVALPPVREKLAAVEEHLLLPAALDVHTGDNRLAYAPLASELDAARVGFAAQYATARGVNVAGSDPQCIPRLVMKDRPVGWFATRVSIYQNASLGKLYNRLRGA